MSSGPEVGGQQAERVTINLSVRASDALKRVTRLTGESKTDAIGRALLLYAVLHEAQANKGAIYVRESQDAEMERLRIF